MMSVEKIFVMSVPKVSVQGRTHYEYRGSEGNSQAIGRSRARGVSIPIQFPRQDNRLITGLDETITNPFKGLECKASNWLEKWDKIDKADELSLQQVYEIKDNVPAGTYTSVVTTPTMASASSSPKQVERIESERTFLEGFRCYLEEGTNVFSADTDRGRWCIHICKNHPLVAKNSSEVNHDLHEFYIGEEEEAEKRKVEKRNIVMDAMSNLGNLVKSYPHYSQQQVMTILKLNYADTSETTTKSSLQEYVFEDRKTANGTQLERIETFNKLYELLEKEPDRVYVKYLVEQAIKNYVILLDGGKYIWRSQKGIDNLYSLGIKGHTVENLFLQEYELYDPKDPNPDNAYVKLINELKGFGVKTL